MLIEGLHKDTCVYQTNMCVNVEHKRSCLMVKLVQFKHQIASGMKQGIGLAHDVSCVLVLVRLVVV